MELTKLGVVPPWYEDITAFNCYASHQQVLDDYIKELFADCEKAFWFGQHWQEISHINGEPVTEDDLVYIIQAIREG